jgi:hypothetical protein
LARRTAASRFDDAPLPGLLSDMVAIDLCGRTPQEFAAMITAELAAGSCDELARNEQSAILHTYDRLSVDSGRDHGA